MTNQQNLTSQPNLTVTRRDFLSFVWKSLLGLSGLLSAAGILKFLAYPPDPAPPTVFDLGPASQFSSSTWLAISEAQAVVRKTSHGFQALSLVCPHLGCTVNSNPEGFACPCHGSRFSLDGSLQHGPASHSLKKLQVKVDEQGNLILKTAEN